MMKVKCWAEIKLFVLWISVVVLTTTAETAEEYCASNFDDSSSFSASVQAEATNAIESSSADQDDVVKQWQDQRDPGDSESLAKVLKDEGEVELADYGQTLLPFAIPGIVCFSLALCISPCVIVARMCCRHKCCKPGKEHDEYNKFERWAPMISYNIFAIAACVVAIMGIIDMGNLRSGSSHAICELDAMIKDVHDWSAANEGYLNDFNSIISGGQISTTRSSTAPSHPSSISCQNSIRGKVTARIYNIKGVVGGAKDVWATANNNQQTEGDLFCEGQGDAGQQPTFPTPTLAARIDDVIAKIAAAEATCTASNTACSDCSADATAWASAETAVTSKLNDIKTNLPATVDILWSKIAGFNNEHSRIALGVTQEIRNYTATDGLLRDGLDLVMSQTIDMSQTLNNYGLFFFSTCFLASFVGLFSVFAWLTPCKCDDKIGAPLLDLSWILSLLFMTVMFLLGGFGVPLAIAYSDACVVLKDIPVDTNGYFGGVFNTTAAYNPVDVIDTCFNVLEANDNLFSVLPDAYDYAVSAATPWFDTNAASSVSAMTSSGIKFDLNNLYTSQISTPLVGAGKGSGASSCSQVSDLTSAMNDLLTRVGNVEESLIYATGASEGRAKLIAEVNYLKSLDGTGSGTDAKLNGCGFVKGYYNAIQDHMCGTALMGLSSLVTNFFVIAVLGIFLVATAICTSINVFARGHGSGQVAPNNFVN